MESDEKLSVQLLYDGDCPICNRYKDYIALRNKFHVELLNAREHPQLVKRLREQGYDMDKGMILLRGDQVYHRSEVLVMMEMMIHTTGWADRILQFLLKRPLLMKVAYPFLFRIRWLLLKLWGKSTHI